MIQKKILHLAGFFLIRVRSFIFFVDLLEFAVFDLIAASFLLVIHFVLLVAGHCNFDIYDQLLQHLSNMN